MAVETTDFPRAGRQLAGAYPIPLVRASTAGFVGCTERGPVNEPVLIRSFAEFYQRFGGHISDSTVPHAVQDYFLHGGRAAVIVRIANRATRAELRCPAGAQVLCFAARDPGSQEILRVSIDYDAIAEADHSRFNLVVQRLRRDVATVIADQELYPGVSIDDRDDRYIVDVLRESRLIHVSGPVPTTRPDATPPERPGDAVRYIGLSRNGTDGQPLTDYDLIGSRSQGTGLFAFDRGPRIDLLCVPPAPGRRLGPTVQVAAERISARRRSLFVFDPPWDWDTPARAIAGARALGSGSRHAMTYYPRIRPRGDRARYGNGLPACGAIAGVLAHRDGRGQWRNAGDVLLKTSLTATQDVPAAEAAVLQRCGVNVFNRGTVGQTALHGNLTLGSSRQLGKDAHTLEHGRLLDFVLTSVEDAVEFALSHYFGGTTLAALERQVEQFLGGLWERDALVGADASQAFYVRAREEDDSVAVPRLRFGMALERAGKFVEVEILLTHERRPVARLVAGLEAEGMLF